MQYFGGIPENFELHEPYQNRECLHCHGGARTFEEGATHNMEDGRLESIKSRALSCLSIGCHDAGHGVKGLGDKTFLTPGSGAHESTGSESPQAPLEEKCRVTLRRSSDGSAVQSSW